MGVFDTITINVGRVTVPEKAEFLRNYCVVSAGNSTVDANTIKMVSADDWKTYVTGDNETSKWLTSFFTLAKGKACYIFECGSSGTAEAKLKALENFINEGVTPCYKYSLPQALYKDSYLATLLDKYNGEDTPIYFSAVCDTTSNTNPQSQTEYVNWKGRKAFMSFYPSLSDANFNLDGFATGVMASSAFDIDSSNTMRSLERMLVSSSSKDLGATLNKQIADAPCVISLNRGNKNRLRNTKMADGYFWHTRYAQDYVLFLIKSNVDALFDTSADTAGSAITYNESGIQSVKQNLITTLKSARSLGLINRFGASIDISTGAITGQGDLTSIPFEEYKNANPTNYNEGIYSGYSGYIEIQGFIVKIIFNVTLG